MKHTVYGSLLDTLLTRSPWAEGSCVHECHAGRGMYRIDRGDERERLLARLHRGGRGLLAQRAQERVLSALSVAPSDSSGWYAGSALQVSTLLRLHASEHRHIAYEWDPATRRVLSAALDGLGDDAIETEVVGAEHDARLDGETALVHELKTAGPGDVVLLDPFGLWRHAKHAERRARYRRIMSTLRSRGDQAPALLMFWTWGRDAATATGDLEGRAAPVDNGYAELRTLLSSAARPLAVVSWHWDLACAIWLWLPEAAMAACCDRVAHELDALGSRLGPGLRWELRID